MKVDNDRANPPWVLFSAAQPSVGRTLASALVAVGLSKRHNVLLADWGFDQSPLLRYFDAEHLSVVYPGPVSAGIFVAPKLALFSSSHFSDGKAASEELLALGKKADILVLCSASVCPQGLEQKFRLGFAVFDYQEESTAKVAETVKEMSAVCRETLAIPSRVDRESPVLEAQRQRLRETFPENSGVLETFEDLELPIISDKAGLFNLPAAALDAETARFSEAAVAAVAESCSPGSSGAFPEHGPFPSLTEKVGDVVEFLLLPPLSGLSEEEARPRGPSPAPFGASRVVSEEDLPPMAETAGEKPEQTPEPVGDHAADAEEDFSQALDAESDAGPEEEAYGESESERVIAGVHKRMEISFLVDVDETDEPAKKADREADKVPPLLDGNFPLRELEEWAGLNLPMLIEKHRAALVAAGLDISEKGPVALFAGLNRAYREWSAAKRGKLLAETLLYCLWLAEGARENGNAIEASIRQRVELLFSGAGPALLGLADLKVIRLLNLIGLLETNLASSSASLHEEAERIVLQAINMTPEEETARSDKLLQLRRVALGLGVRLPSVQEDAGKEIGEQFERERDSLPVRLLRLLPEFGDMPVPEGDFEDAGKLELPIAPPAGERDVPPAAPEKDERNPLQGKSFPLRELQDWAGYEIKEPLKRLEKAIKKDGFAFPSADLSTVEAYATFNKQYRSWNKARKSKYWAETILLCLALADQARERGEPVEENIRERVEEMFKEADEKSMETEAVQILRLLNLIGVMVSSLEIGDSQLLERAEQVLLKIVVLTAEASKGESDTILQLRRVALGLGLYLPLLHKESEARAREMFEKERDELPKGLLQMFPGQDIRAKVRDIREKVADLI